MQIYFGEVKWSYNSRLKTGCGRIAGKMKIEFVVGGIGKLLKALNDFFV